MQTEKRLASYYKRWNIGLDYDEEYRKFKNRLVSSVNRLFGKYIADNEEVDRDFLQFIDLDKADKPQIEKSRPIYKKRNTPTSASLASQVSYILESLPDEFKPREIESWTDKGFGDTNVYSHVEHCENIRELAKAVQFLCWVLEEKDASIQGKLPTFAKELKMISALTPVASFSISRRGKKITIYPNGDPLLDQEVVNYSLSKLEEYPNSAKYFEKALRIYQSSDEDNYRELLDNLRFSLEQFLKEVLKNKKSLENQNSFILPWLKDRGIHKQTVNLYNTLLNQYCSYQNDAVKHNENFSVDEIEFMIYLTGNFMRLILTLSSK